MVILLLFEHSELVISEEKHEHVREMRWPSFVDGITIDRVDGVTTVGEDDGMVALSDGVSALLRPDTRPLAPPCSWRRRPTTLRSSATSP
jgi:hypothetical protein